LMQAGEQAHTISMRTVRRLLIFIVRCNIT
jgi:hypothetical protein